jgi:hypothetical protein
MPSTCQAYSDTWVPVDLPILSKSMQGMSFLAAPFLLLGFDTEFAFAGLCFLVEHVCPSYHAVGLEGFVRDVAVLDVFQG